MKIGIISDSHDHNRNVLKAVGVFGEQKVNYILHAGDIVSPSTARAFAGVLGAKFIAVYGNCDRDKLLLKEAIEDFGGEIHEHVYTGEIEGRRIFMAHRPNVLSEVADTDEYDLVIYGHTHKQFIHKVGETLIINPGKSAGRLIGKSTVVVLELGDMSCKSVLLI